MAGGTYGSQASVWRDVYQDPALALTLLGAALPSVYYGEQRVLTPGPILGLAGRLYDVARQRREQEQLLRRGIQATDVASLPAPSVRDPEKILVGQPTSVSLAEQIQRLESRRPPPLSTLLAGAPPSRLLAAFAPAGQLAQPFYQLYGELRGQAVTELDRQKKGVFVEALRRLGRDPQDEDAKEAMLTLYSDIPNAPALKALLDQEDARQAKVSLLQQRFGFSPETSRAYVLAGLAEGMIADDLTRERTRRDAQKAVEAMKDLIPPHLFQVFHGLATATGVAPSPETAVKLAQDQAFADLMQLHPGLFSALEKGIPVDARVITQVTSDPRFRHLAPWLHDAARAAQQKFEERDRWEREYNLRLRQDKREQAEAERRERVEPLSELNTLLLMADRFTRMLNDEIMNVNMSPEPVAKKEEKIRHIHAQFADRMRPLNRLIEQKSNEILKLRFPALALELAQQQLSRGIEKLSGLKDPATLDRGVAAVEREMAAYRQLLGDVPGWKAVEERIAAALQDARRRALERPSAPSPPEPSGTELLYQQQRHMGLPFRFR